MVATGTYCAPHTNVYIEDFQKHDSCAVPTVQLSC